MITIVIPARLGSTRLPNKPLQDIHGKPMIWWTWQKAIKTQIPNNTVEVIIATDNTEIKNIMESYGANCVMTSESCQSGTDRVYEIAKDSKYSQDDIFVNFQGDEPMMPLDLVEGAINLYLENKSNNIRTDITTATSNFARPEDFHNINQVKAVCNKKNQAIYFSRAELAGGQLHLGIYVYNKKTLEEFTSLEQGKLEVLERLEQLRAFENNMPIYIYHQDFENSEHFGIDTPDDLARAKELLKN